MRALDEGEDFIVTRNGRPVGELRPYRPRQFIPRDVFLAAFEGAPHIDYEKFRARHRRLRRSGSYAPWLRPHGGGA